MKTALVLLAIIAGAQIGWAQQTAIDESMAQWLERETRHFGSEEVKMDRQSIRILDSSQLNSGVTSFRLAGLQRISGDGYLATVRCASSSECLPFLVSFRSTAMVAVVDHPKRKRRVPPAVRRGDRVRLEMEITGGWLSFPVVCLEEGSVGEIVRTKAVGNRRIFTALVTGPRQVRGMETAQ